MVCSLAQPPDLYLAYRLGPYLADPAWGQCTADYHRGYRGQDIAGYPHHCRGAGRAHRSHPGCHRGGRGPGHR